MSKKKCKIHSHFTKNHSAIPSSISKTNTSSRIQALQSVTTTKGSMHVKCMLKLNQIHLHYFKSASVLTWMLCCLIFAKNPSFLVPLLLGSQAKKWRGWMDDDEFDCEARQWWRLRVCKKKIEGLGLVLLVLVSVVARKIKKETLICEDDGEFGW